MLLRFASRLRTGSKPLATSSLLGSKALPSFRGLNVGCSRSFATVRRYTKSHEYVQFEEGAKEGLIGISNFAQDELGDVVYVELPEKGSQFASGEVIASVESVKAAGSVYSPVDVTVLDANTALTESPNMINESPYEKGWMIKAKFKDASQLKTLLNEAQYEEYVKQSSHK